MRTKTLLAYLLLALTTLNAQGQCRLLPLDGGNTVQQCDLLIPSPRALKREIFVKAWLPARVDNNTDVVVFLHGRGYARSPGQASSMIEDMGLHAYLASNEYKLRPFIVLAPQDNIVQTDNEAIGEDYWVGADGRDWQSFLSGELVDAINRHFALRPRLWKAIGVSMGAHGAMMLAMYHPEVYKAFAALSPVFRASLAEIGANDYDVFVRDGAIVNNIGYQLLQNVGLPNLPAHYIRVHQFDFGLATDKFPSAPAVWARLTSLPQGPKASVVISRETGIEPGMGHAMGYWRRILPDALTWLSN